MPACELRVHRPTGRCQKKPPCTSAMCRHSVTESVTQHGLFRRRLHSAGQPQPATLSRPMNSVSGSNQLSLTRLWQSASESKSTIRQVGAAAAIFISTVTVIPIVTDIITTCVRARSARRVEPVALTPSQGPGPDRNLTPDNKHDRPESPCVRSDTGPTPEAQERASHISRCIANMIQERGDNSFCLGLITREASDPEQLQSLTDIAEQLPVRWDMDFENAPKFVSAWRELRALIADAPLTSRMEVAQSLVKSLTNNSHYLINNPRKGKPLEFQPESDAELTAALYKKYPDEQIYLPPMYGRLDPKEAVQEGELFLAHLTRSLLANGVDACDALL